MSKFMKEEEREQKINDLMLAIRRNTQDSKCIDVFENLLREIPDKNVVDTVIADIHRFIADFSRLCKDGLGSAAHFEQFLQNRIQFIEKLTVLVKPF